MTFIQELFTNRFIKDLLWSIAFVSVLYAITHNPIVRPIPQPLPGNWSIQFMQHPLLFGFAGHNYLALRNHDGTIVSELHGLATDSFTGEWKYVGSKATDKLRVWEFESGRYYLAEKTFPGIILKEGSEEEVKAVWNIGISCKDPINSKNIDYPPYGVRIRNETTNSNSVAYTLARCMNLDTRHIGIWTPGDAMNLLK
jgi:hypothetical protein